MADSVSERVAQFMQGRSAPRSGKARATVVALGDEIQNALKGGWSVKAIWQALYGDGTVQVGYPAFCRYVAALRKGGKEGPAGHRTGHAPLPQTSDRGPAFQHDRVPQKKDIYG